MNSAESNPVPHLRRGLYVITDGPRDDLLAVCEAALMGGAVALQYRDKTNDPIRRSAEARALLDLCRRHSATFIVNDDIALARATGADGVHLGEDDVDPAAARALLGPQAMIGVSCYNSLSRARAQARAGADYLAFGAFFSSPTKPGTRRADLDLLRQGAALGLPLVAIGGISANHAAPLIAAGAHCVAVISAVFGAADVRAAARGFSDVFSSADQTSKS